MKGAERQRKSAALTAECIHEACRYLRRNNLTYSPDSRYARIAEMIHLFGRQTDSLNRPWANVEDQYRAFVIPLCQGESSLSQISPSEARMNAKLLRAGYRIEPLNPAATPSADRDAIVKHIRRIQPFARHKDDVEKMMQEDGLGASGAFVEDPFLEDAAAIVVDDAPDFLGCQVVAFRIRWNDGPTAILEAFERWLKRQRWASKRRAGPKENFPKVQRWLQVVELLDAGKSDYQVQRILGADKKTVATARKNLTTWLKRWLGVKPRPATSTTDASHGGK